MSSPMAKPIFKSCPHCNDGVISQWYWTYEENESERGLKAVECSCELDPLELGLGYYADWKADPNNFYPQRPLKKVASKTEEELLSTVPPSKRVARS
jgi:hypothetical protein